jgi:hypothetical protein
MEQVGSITRFVVAMLTLVTILFALGACGPRVVSGNENTVVIKNGPWYPLIKAESSAQSYCEHYDKRPSYEGGHVELGTLWYIYYFDCVDNTQS